MPDLKLKSFLRRQLRLGDRSEIGAGWSSPVARQAHNLKVVGSNPTPATNYLNKINDLYAPQELRFLGFFCVLSLITITE